MDSPNIGIGSGSATCIACGNEVSHFVVVDAMEGAPRFCHPCAGARLMAPLPDAVAALVEEARRSDHAADDLNPCAVRYGEPCNCGVATHNARIDRLAAALAAQARDLAAAHAALNGHATAGLPLAKQIAAALGTHAHDIAEMQRRVEEVARERDAATQRVGWANAARAEARWEADRAIEERDAATARAEKAEAALAKVAERLAMAKVFDVGDGVTIERSRSGYYIERQVQPRGRRWMTEFLLPAGIWQRRTLHCFPDVDAALAALAVSRG